MDQVHKTSIAEIHASSGLDPKDAYLTYDFGVPGMWEIDESDTTSADNTGTILVTSDGQRLKRKFSGRVDIRWFGAIGDDDATTDSTQAIQAAFDFLDSTRINPNGQNNFGVGELYIPRGRYKIASTITINRCYGLMVCGDSPYASSLEYHSDSGIMFQINSYITFTISNLIIFHSTESDPATWTNMCFSYNHLGGSQDMKFDRVRISGFNRQFNIEGTQGNDTFHFHNCRFGSFNTYWWSDNSQSIGHSWDSCLWTRYNKNVFDISAGSYYNISNVYMQSYGPLFNLRGGAWGIGSHFSITNLKSEWVADSYPGGMFINCEDDGIIASFHIKGSALYGGSAALERPVFTLRGDVDVLLESCTFREGTVELYRTAQLISTGRVRRGDAQMVWKNCRALPPTAVNILSDVGMETYPHITLRYEDCQNVPDQEIMSDTQRGTTHAHLSTSLVQLAAGIDATNMNRLVDAASARGIDFPVYSRTVIKRIVLRIIEDFDTGTPQVTAFYFYSDSAKTNLIGLQNVPALTVNTTYEILIPDGTYTDEGIFITITNPGASPINGYIKIDYSTVGIK